MPVGNVLVGDTGGNIKHDDTALAVDVVTITETTELLLSSGVPHVELDLTVVLWFRISFGFGCEAREVGTNGREAEGVDLNTKGGHVLLLEFTSQVALDEGGLQHFNDCQLLYSTVWVD